MNTRKATRTKLIIAMLSLMIAACIGGFIASNFSPKKADASSTFYYANYSGINTISNVTTYLGDLSNSYVSDGVVVSPYYTLTVNGQSVPVYATRTANGVHSFVYLDVDLVDNAFNLDLVITGSSMSTVFKNGVSVTVLPEKHGVTASVNRSSKRVTASINKLGSYSFVFNKTYLEPLTIMVQEKEDTAELFGTKQIQYINAGDYSTKKTYTTTRFSAQNTVYYFRAGRYQIDQITIPSNSVVYFEKGAYLEVKASPLGNLNPFFYGVRAQNITIAGRPLFDMSACQGAINYDGSVRDKTGFCIEGSTNVKIQGVSIINSQTWTLCCTDCTNLEIDKLMFFGYRTYADGVMIANSVNAMCKDSFIRTGDDAFETKSTSLNGMKTNGVTFKGCDAWTDKAIAFGCVYESTYDQENVTFVDCTVGFALGNWSEHLGNCVIQLGQQDSIKTTSNVKFKDIEIYHNNNNAVLNCYVGGNGGSGDGAGTIKDIYFQNITCKTNNGNYMVNLQTYDSTDCSIKDIYIDNLVVGGTKLTTSNRNRNVNTSKVVGGYNTSLLHINTLPTTYNVYVTANNASVSGVTTGEYEENSSVSVTVKANVGYYIDSITWNGSAVNVTNDSQMSFSKTITATTDLVVVAKPLPNYMINIESANAVITGITAGSYQKGASFNVTVTAQKGYLIKSISWNGQEISVTNNQTQTFNITLSADSTLKVETEEKVPENFVVTIDKQNVTITGITASTYLEGTVCNVFVQADKGYVLSKVLLNNQPLTIINDETMSFSVTITENVTLKIVATEKPTAIVTVNVGNVTVEGISSGEYQKGTTFNLSITAKDGYEITAISWNDQDIQVTNNLLMQFDVTLSSDTTLIVSTKKIQLPPVEDDGEDTIEPDEEIPKQEEPVEEEKGEIHPVAQALINVLENCTVSINGSEELGVIIIAFAVIILAIKKAKKQ